MTTALPLVVLLFLPSQTHTTFMDLVNFGGLFGRDSPIDDINSVAMEYQPHVRLDPTIAVSGAIDRALLTRVMRRHLNDLRLCAGAARLRRDAFAGRITIELVVEDGASFGAMRVVSSTIESPALTRCIVEVASHWEFIKPRGGRVVLTCPFVFDSV